MEQIGETFLNAQEHFKSLIEAESSDFFNADEAVERLLSLLSTAQRTEEWYKQGQQVLSASQFATLFKSARTRAQLVLEKAKIVTTPLPPPRLCCSSVDIRPFDWGIRFEPVVKAIYESITRTRLADLGRLIHPTIPNLAASPDGLVVEDLGDKDKRKGRFVEFKAPITRQINDQVPEDYYKQMQIQMEVGDVTLCDYFEVSFISPYGMKEFIAPSETENFVAKGQLFLIGELETDRPLRYEYPPINNMTWMPTLSQHEFILETIPWFCKKTFMKTVPRSKLWFESVKPAIQAFWEDVEKAKRGDFVLPESTRKKKEVVCEIMDEVA
jgi:hypothetical protein